MEEHKIRTDFNASCSEKTIPEVRLPKNTDFDGGRLGREINLYQGEQRTAEQQSSSSAHASMKFVVWRHIFGKDLFPYLKVPLDARCLGIKLNRWNTNPNPNPKNTHDDYLWAKKRRSEKGTSEHILSQFRIALPSPSLV